MARKRLIDPMVWDDGDLVDLSIPEHLLFIGLISFTDDYGHVTANAALLKKWVFGYRDITTAEVQTMVDNLLAKCRNLHPYIVNGQRLIWLSSFERHQDLRWRGKAQYPCHVCGKHHEPSDFAGKDAIRAHVQLPICQHYDEQSLTQDYVSITQELTQDLPPNHVHVETKLNHVHDHVDTASSTPESAPEQAPIEPVPKAKSLKPDYSADFEQFWSIYPRREEKRGAFKQWSARTKGGALPDQLIAAALNYATASEGTETCYIKLPATFLGEKRPYEDWIGGIPPGRIKTKEAINDRSRRPAHTSGSDPPETGDYSRFTKFD